MCHFLSKLAREAVRLTGWREKIFGRRYKAIVISSEEAAQIERLRYILANGTKEGLVERPQDWPGVHAVRALLGEEVLEGIWIDQPLRSKKSPVPRFHAASREARRYLYRLYAEFVAQYREAAERLLAGDRHAPFPPGCSLPPCHSSADNARGPSPSLYRRAPLSPELAAKETCRPAVAISAVGDPCTRRGGLRS
jgi:hypothetical protein